MLYNFNKKPETINAKTKVYTRKCNDNLELPMIFDKKKNYQ